MMNKGIDTSKNNIEMETIAIHVREKSLDSDCGNAQRGILWRFAGLSLL